MKLRSGIDLRSAVCGAVERVVTEKAIYRSCINCINFREQPELCGLVMQRPPARIIAYGCPKWEDKEEIPF